MTISLVDELSLLAANADEPLERAVHSSTAEEVANNELEETGSLSPSSETTVGSTSFIMVDDNELESTADNRLDLDVPSDSIEPVENTSDAVPDLGSVPEFSETETTFLSDDLPGSFSLFVPRFTRSSFIVCPVSANDDDVIGEPLQNQTPEDATTTTTESLEDFRAESPASELGEHGDIRSVPGSPTQSEHRVMEEDIRAAINEDLDASPSELAMDSPSISAVGIASTEEVTDSTVGSAQASVTNSVDSVEDVSEAVLEAPLPVGSEKVFEDSEPIISPVSAVDVSITASAMELSSEVMLSTETPEASPVEPSASMAAEILPATPESVSVESLSAPSSPVEEEIVDSEPAADIDAQDTSSPVLDTLPDTLIDDTLHATDGSDVLDVVAEPAGLSATLGNDSVSDDMALNTSAPTSPMSSENLALKSDNASANDDTTEYVEEVMETVLETPDVLPAAHTIDATEVAEPTAETAAIPETIVSEPLITPTTPTEALLEELVEKEEPVHAVDETPQGSDSDALPDDFQPTSPISSPAELVSTSSEIVAEEPVTLVEEPVVENAAAPEEMVDELLEDAPQSAEMPLDSAMEEERPVLAIQETSEDSVSDNSRPASPISSPAELAAPSSEIVGDQSETLVEGPLVETSTVLDAVVGEPLENVADSIKTPLESTEEEESVHTIDETQQSIHDVFSGSQLASPISSPTEIASSSSGIVDEEPMTLMVDTLESEVPAVTQASMTPTAEVSPTPVFDDNENAEVEPTFAPEEAEASEELSASTVTTQEDVLPPLPDDEFDEFSEDLDSQLAASAVSDSLLDSLFLVDSEQNQTPEPVTGPFTDPAIEEENPSDAAAAESKDDTPATPVVDEFVATQQSTVPPQDGATGMADSWIVLPPDEQDVESALAQHVPAALLTSISEDASFEVKEVEKSDDVDDSLSILNELAPPSPIAPIVPEEETVDAASEDETKNDAQSHTADSQPLDTESL